MIQILNKFDLIPLIGIVLSIYLTYMEQNNVCNIIKFLIVLLISQQFYKNIKQYKKIKQQSSLFMLFGFCLSAVGNFTSIFSGENLLILEFICLFLSHVCFLICFYLESKIKIQNFSCTFVENFLITFIKFLSMGVAMQFSQFIIEQNENLSILLIVNFIILTFMIMTSIQRSKVYNNWSVNTVILGAILLESSYMLFVAYNLSSKFQLQYLRISGLGSYIIGMWLIYRGNILQFDQKLNKLKQ